LTETIVSCNVCYMGERKNELLDSATEYLLKNGIADLSLRPLAKAIGTSARLLIFHFTSKEILLEAVLEEIQRRVRMSFDAACLRNGGKNQASPMTQFWRWASAADQLPYWRLLYEVQFIALQHPKTYARYLRGVSIRWSAAIEVQLPVSLRSRTLAVLCGAVFDGLMMELITTEDIKRTTSAIDLFVEWMRNESRKTDPSAASQERGRRRVRTLKRTTPS
jgi:AcrR family transcriptional regulator